MSLQRNTEKARCPRSNARQYNARRGQMPIVCNSTRRLARSSASPRCRRGALERRTITKSRRRSACARKPPTSPTRSGTTQTVQTRVPRPKNTPSRACKHCSKWSWTNDRSDDRLDRGCRCRARAAPRRGRTIGARARRRVHRDRNHQSRPRSAGQAISFARRGAIRPRLRPGGLRDPRPFQESQLAEQHRRRDREDLDPGEVMTAVARYRVWCLSWDEEEEHGANVVEVPTTVLRDAADAAEAYADYVHSERDGWEATWPLVFRVRCPDGSTADFEVDREYVPEFSAAPIKPRIDSEESAA